MKVRSCKLSGSSTRIGDFRSSAGKTVVFNFFILWLSIPLSLNMREHQICASYEVVFSIEWTQLGRAEAEYTFSKFASFNNRKETYDSTKVSCEAAITIQG